MKSNWFNFSFSGCCSQLPQSSALTVAPCCSERLVSWRACGGCKPCLPGFAALVSSVGWKAERLSSGSRCVSWILTAEPCRSAGRDLHMGKNKRRDENTKWKSIQVHTQKHVFSQKDIFLWNIIETFLSRQREIISSRFLLFPFLCSAWCCFYSTSLKENLTFYLFIFD